MALEYSIGRSGDRIVFTDHVLNHFMKFQQNNFWKKEAGGALFARSVDRVHRVEEASGPFQEDWRGRQLFVPNRLRAQTEINMRFQQGLNFVGTWHTHPERVPAPSSLDLISIANVYKCSQHSLNAMLLVVVGTDKYPDGISVSLHDGNSQMHLSLIQAEHATAFG